MFSFSSPKALWLPLLIGALLLACQAPASGTDVSPASPQALESPPAPAPENEAPPTPTPPQPTEAATTATVSPIQPPTRSPLPFIPPTLPPLFDQAPEPTSTASPTATPVPDPDSTAAPEPNPTAEPAAAATSPPASQPEATPAPEPAAVPQPTAAPTPEPTPEPQPQPAGDGGAEGAEIAAQLAEIRSSLQWVANFDDEFKTWSVYDPSGTFDASRADLFISESISVGQLTNLRDSHFYWVAVSQDVVLQGQELRAGVNQIIWSDP